MKIDCHQEFYLLIHWQKKKVAMARVCWKYTKQNQYKKQSQFENTTFPKQVRHYLPFHLSPGDIFLQITITV